MTESIQPAPLQEPVSVDDNSGSLTVDNAGLTELAGAIDTEMQVDVVTSALPTGAATSAKQDTIIGHVDGVETLLGTIDADTGTIAGAVSGTEMQVDVLTIAAGDNNIGNVDVASIAAGDNNIGNVDVVSAIPGTGATNLGKAEDGGHTTGDTGVAMLAVRRDAEAVGSDSDGDYSTVNVDGSGRVWTHDGVLDAALSGSELQVDVVGALPAGTNAIGKLAANSGVDIGDVDVTSIAAGTNVIGKVRLVTANGDEVTEDTGDTVKTSPTALATGGAETFHSNDLDETEEDVKTAAGTVYGWIITNRTTAPVYVHFYNATAANVTVGTTAPLFNFAVPGNASDYIAANLLGGIGIAFSTAISVAATTDFPDDGSPAGPAANGVVCTVFYK